MLNLQAQALMLTLKPVSYEAFVLSLFHITPSFDASGRLIS